MDHLPVFLKIERRPCLVVGGGQVAGRKARLLLRAGASVTVAAPGLDAALAAMRDRREIRHHAGAFEDALLEGQRLVIAATDDGKINEQVARAADRAGVPCNVVDDNAASGFILPAIVDRAPVTIAIGTGGNAPVLAQRLKSDIERWLPARIGLLAERAGRWRSLVRRRFASLDERRRFWQRFFDGPIARHILANRESQAERLVRLELMGGGVPHPRPAGEAYIVGAGPGDPGLVTIRAQQLIAQADVVLYDRLVSKPILDYARKEAELIAVGKAAGRSIISQGEINRLLVRLVREGKRVCRLKGGDPFVFGRGAEEARALAGAGLSYEIVPGISAALGCAAYAGIPLTLRGTSGRVTLASARLDGDSQPDWEALAKTGQTLALYMSAGAVEDTGRQLVRHGLAPDTPASMVENGTTTRQRVLHSSLAHIADEARTAGFAAPAMLFIGEAVGLAPELTWFDGGTADEDAFDAFSDVNRRSTVPSGNSPAA